MTSKVVCKVMASGGTLKSGTLIRECNTEKNLIGISNAKIIKKVLEKKNTLFEKKRNHGFYSRKCGNLFRCIFIPQWYLLYES